MKNYDDVLGQLQAAGLRPETPLAINGALTRSRVEDDREKRGWYVLHELPGDDGGLIVGSFGVWRGNDNGAHKVELGRGVGQALSAEQRKAMGERLRADARKADAARKARAERAARRAESVWKKCGHVQPEDGASDYLRRKGIGAHGVRYTDGGALAIAMHDVLGRVRGLQFILDEKRQAQHIRRLGRSKTYWPAGVAPSGLFFLIGSPRDLVLVTEGYATAASLHEATGHPVAVAFSAGNIIHVVKALRKRYRDAHILCCADDDYIQKCHSCRKPTPVAEQACSHCGEKHGQSNAGIMASSTAALAVPGASWIAPRFAEDRGGEKITDFNDLHAREGLLSVRVQIEACIVELGWDRPAARDATTGEEGRPGFAFDLDILLREFTLIYGTDTVFDAQRHRIIGLGPLRAAAGKSLVRMWLEHPDRQIVEPELVGFDPAGEDSSIRCNLWSGWPTVPRRGSCEHLLRLLEYLTSHDKLKGKELASWVEKWLAYPIQNPGAKMQTAVLMHGPEGTGKNTLFAAVRRIYGRYGTQFSQVELESNFNGWAAGKLFAIGNEVVSRAELYHIQGRLKSMVTESEWIINEKMLPARAEANHCNFVFFSNRVDIAKLDPDDRRYCVIWTPEKAPSDVYEDVAEELRNGGIEALHDHLLNVDLEGFSPHTLPPMTTAKQDLVELSMDSTERFYRDWVLGDIDGVPCGPCRSEDLYALYRVWAQREGIVRGAQKQTLLTAIGKKPGVIKRQERFTNGAGDEKKMVIWPIGDQDPPDDRSKGVWLGGEIHEFRLALDQYRDDFA